jgi:hypothetical protein
MSNIKKLMMSGAGGAPGLDVDEVFSTYLYTGNGGTQTVTNNIDVSTEGALIWTKGRSSARGNNLWDTDGGVHQVKMTDQGTGGTFVEPSSVGMQSFNTDGFTIGGSYFSSANIANTDYASWTFRKAPKFFDIVTYTGNGTSQTISHNLGSDIGFMVVKKTSAAGNWIAWHRSFANTAQGRLILNSNSDYNFATSYWNNTAPTSTGFTVGSNQNTNHSGQTFVAYLWAHNNGDGGFGPTGDQDIIKCGSHTISTTDADEVVDLGFEAQWVLTKQGTNDWVLLDTMRGLTAADINDPYLRPNLTSAEGLTSTPDAHAKGFTLKGSSGNETFYIAIRRGSLFPPENATEVFTPLLGLTSSTAPPLYQATHTIDAVIEQPRFGDSAVIIDRLRANGDTGKLLKTATTGSELGNSSYTMDYQTGAFNKYSGQATWYVGQCFRRAPGFFDVVAYNGNSTDGRTISHNLGVTPEMMWVKRRDSYHGGQGWVVYHKNLDATNPAHKYLRLNDSEGVLDSDGKWYDTAPTESVFTVANNTDINNSNGKYIAWLFATLSGVSKVGSYTGNGSSQTINCGFTSGARFILIKRLAANSDWYVWDTARGIVAGNDPYLELNTTDAEVTSTDWVDPNNSGFIVNGTTINASGGSYIFYAVA